MSFDAENVKLREVEDYLWRQLEKYGRHTPDCNWEGGRDTSCDCGWERLSLMLALGITEEDIADSRPPRPED